MISFFVFIRLLKSLHEAPGLNTQRLAIYVEKPAREVINLAKLFGITMVESGEYPNISTPIAVRHKVQRIFRYKILNINLSKDRELKK